MTFGYEICGVEGAGEAVDLQEGVGFLHELPMHHFVGLAPPQDDRVSPCKNWFEGTTHLTDPLKPKPITAKTLHLCP